MDYYETLGVSKDASSQDIKSAYRKQALKYHPDTNQGDKEAEDMFKNVSTAYSVLSDLQKRKMYDMGVDPNQNGGFGHGRDPFADMFNMGFGRNFRQEGPQQPKIVNILVKINLYESIFGTERNVEFNYNEICKVCDGSGVKEWETCNVCGGSGTCTAQHSPNSRIIMPCNACRGKGKISKVRCGACGGGGIAGVKTKELTINIKPGITPGESMIIHGGGIPDAFGNVGPLIINIEIVFPTTSSFSDEDKVILRKVLNK